MRSSTAVADSRYFPPLIWFSRWCCSGIWRRELSRMKFRNNPYLLLALAALFWSGNHIVGRAIGGHVPPVGISTVRWLIPSILILPWVRPHLKRDWPAIRTHWKAMLWLGVTGGALFTALQYVGLQ